MCPLKREQARREMQQWVMRRLPTADSIVEKARKSGSWIKGTVAINVALEGAPKLWYPAGGPKDINSMAA